MWKEYVKRGLAVLDLITLVPYIVTVFVQGAGNKKREDGQREEGILRLAREVSEYSILPSDCVRALPKVYSLIEKGVAD